MAGKIFSDIYTESARDTGDQTASHITYVKKKTNDALREVCSEMKYSWLQRSADLTLTASLQYYLMTTFAPLWDEDTPISLYYRAASGKRIYLENYDDSEWEGQESSREGTPYGFNVNKKSGAYNAYLTFIPDSGFVSSFSPMKMDYQKYPTELSAPSDVPEIPTSHHQALVWWTNALICLEMGDQSGAADWMKMAQGSIGLLKKKQVHRTGKPKRVYPAAHLTGRSTGFRGDYGR